MANENVVLVYEDDVLVGEDLCEMIEVFANTQCLVFARYADLARKLAQMEGRPRIVFAAYHAESSAVDAHLSRVADQGVSVVLMDGIAAESAARGKEGWFHLRKPFTQDAVWDLLSQILKRRRSFA